MNRTLEHLIVTAGLLLTAYIGWDVFWYGYKANIIRFMIGGALCLGFMVIQYEYLKGNITVK